MTKSRITVYIRDTDNDRLDRLMETYGLGASAAMRAGLAILEQKLSLERSESMIETRDLVGALYNAVVVAATASYWVAPISTDNAQFHAHWRAADRSTEGLVHYEYQDWDSGERPYHSPD